MSPQASRMLGRFELIEELGGSDVATSYRARRHGLQGFEKILLLKVPRRALARDAAFRERLTEQAGIASQLTHANIVQVIELSEEDGTPILALEYVHGTDLKTLVEAARGSDAPFPAALAAFIVSEICKALDFAHRRGGRTPSTIVHGALHPGNVLLSFEGDVKVSDFGFSAGVMTGGATDPAEDVAAAGSILATLLSLSADSTPDLESAALSAQALDPAARPDAGHLFRILAGGLFSAGRRPRSRELAAYLVEVGLRPPLIETGRIPVEASQPTSLEGLARDDSLDPTAPDVLRDAFGISPTQVFVGRNEEMAVLSAAFDTVRAGSMRMILIEGNAGIGKTQLLAAFGRRAIRAGAAVAPISLTREGNAVPLHAARSILRSMLGLPPDPGPAFAEMAAQKVRDFSLNRYESELARRLALGEDAVGLSPSDRVRPIGRVLARMIGKLTSEVAVAILIDDAQHLDRASRAVLEEVMRRTSERALVLVLARTPASRKERFAEATSLPLGPMSDEEVAEVLRLRAGARATDAWIAQICEGAGGSPRVAVELEAVLSDLSAAAAQELLESPSLEQLAMDRVGGLAAHERQALGMASHVGDRVDPALLERLMRSSSRDIHSLLESLTERGMLARRPGNSYAFASDALRGAASREVAPPDEAALHRFVALALASLDQGDPHLYASALMDHAGRGDVRASIASPLARRGRALAATGAGAGLDLMLEALRASRDEMEADPAKPLALAMEVGELALGTGQYHEGVAALRFGRVLARRASNARRLLDALRLSARLLTRAERYSDAFRLLEEAHTVAQGMGDETAIAESHGGIGEALTQMGEFLRARPYLELALPHTPPTSALAARLHGCAALAAAAGGDTERARIHIAGMSEAQAAHADDGMIECEFYKMTGLVQFALGDLGAAVQAFETGLDRAMELGYRHEAAVASLNAGDCYLRREDLRKAFGAIRYAYEVAREHGFARARAFALYLLSYIDASVLESPEGRERVEREAEQAKTPWDIVQTRFALGRIDLQLGKNESAIANLREALVVGRRTGNLMLEGSTLDLLDQLGVAEPTR